MTRVFVLIGLSFFSVFCAAAQNRALVGMTDTAAYFPLLEGRRVAVLANHTSVAEMPGAGTSVEEEVISDGNRMVTAESPDMNRPAKTAAPDARSAPGSAVPAVDGSASLSDPGSVIAAGGNSVFLADSGFAAYAADSPAERAGRIPAVRAGRDADADAGPTAAEPASRVHLVDLLHARGFDVVAIFSPEHGFRGTADAGEQVGNSRDAKTGIPIRSLYDGNAKRPSDEAMRSFDVLVVDMQDVGLRFYTYYITMLRMMDACAEYGRQVVVLDRPNPNGDKVDGPVLEPAYRSGVGTIPVPVLHGLTMGEIARMAVGEGWTKPCPLTVVRCRNYARADEYLLPVAPSPNLPTQRAVYLYPSLCLFEGTPVSVGRGTDKPFECYGHPALGEYPYAFTPRPTAGAKHPPLEGRLCRGEDLSTMPLAEARRTGFSLRWLLAAYRAMGVGEEFFSPMFDKLAGTGYVREMILEGASEREIRFRWKADADRFLERRKPYLLYE